MGIRIDELPEVITLTSDHALITMKNGETHQLSVQQLSDLILSLVIDGSPDALNTLNELSAALGDDADFAATVTSSLNSRLKLDGTSLMSGDLNLNGNNILNVSNFVGLVGYFPTIAPLNGWLKANGAEISRMSYVNLFNVVGVTFGAGNGSTTFNLPDLRGEFIRGFDDGRGVDDGRVFGSFQIDAFKQHSHQQALGGALSTVSNSAGSFIVGDANESNVSDVGGNETRPRNIALSAYIKY